MTTMTVPASFINGTKVPQTLPELLKLYKEKLTDSQLDLTGEVDYRTRPGLELRKNGAIQALPGLRAEVARLVEQNSAAVFLSGTQKGIEAFIGVAQDLTEGNIVIVDAQEMYRKMAQTTEKGLRRDRRFSMDTRMFFIQSILNVLDELSVDDPIPGIDTASYLNQEYPDTDALTRMVKTAMNSVKTSGGVSAGDGLNSIYIQKRATDEAIKEEVATDFLPVIILNATPEETDGAVRNLVYYGRNIAFEAKDEDVSEAVVTNVFKKLKVQYKSRAARPNK